MKKWFCLFVCLLTCMGLGSATWAQDPSPENDAAFENMGFEEMIATANNYIQTYDDLIASGQEMLDKARQEEDVVLMDCVNSRLVAIRGFYNVAKNSETSLKNAVANKDKNASSHHMKLLNLSYVRSQALASEMQSCLGKELDYTGSTTLETTRVCDVEPCLEGDEYVQPVNAPEPDKVVIDQPGVLDPLVSSFQ